MRADESGEPAVPDSEHELQRGSDQLQLPGTYENAAAIHPTQEEVEKTTVQLGSGATGGAAVGGDDGGVERGRTRAAQGDGGLNNQTILSRTTFFHHMTGSTVHGDQPKVMKLMGKTAANEMLVSAYAKVLAPCFATAGGADRSGLGETGASF